MMISRSQTVFAGQYSVYYENTFSFSSQKETYLQETKFRKRFPFHLFPIYPIPIPLYE